jgi:sulfur carrier protein
MSGEDRLAGQTIRLTVNGEATETRARTLAALLDELGYAGRKVATALNGEFIAERTRPATAIKAGDAIEVVAPRQGG